MSMLASWTLSFNEQSFLLMSGIKYANKKKTCIQLSRCLWCVVLWFCPSLSRTRCYMAAMQVNQGADTDRVITDDRVKVCVSEQLVATGQI